MSNNDTHLPEDSNPYVTLQNVAKIRGRQARTVWASLVIACPLIIILGYLLLAQMGKVTYPSTTTGVLHAGILILIATIMSGFTSVLLPIWIRASLGDPIDTNTQSGRRLLRQLWAVLIIFSCSALLWGFIAAFLIDQIE